MKHIFVRPQKLISIVTGISSDFSLELLLRSLVMTLGIFSGLTIPASADITTGGDGTIVQKNDNTFNITGGNSSSDGKNLFHGFQKFDLTTTTTPTTTITQVANFQTLNGSKVENIFGRVTSREPSIIDGKIQVNGGSNTTAVNLFLMNPAGIVFGKNASLDINGAFTATTAKAIGFGDNQWFSALGGNDYFAGNPINFAFTNTPGSIFNAANLTTKPGKSITLVGGTVISTGDIKTAGGNISIATIKGGKYVQIEADGSILRLDLPVSDTSKIATDPPSFQVLTLAELLTGKTTTLLPIATGVTFDNKNKVIKLVGDTRSILSGDIVTKNLDTSGDPNGGKVSLNTQAGDIIVNSIETRSRSSGSDGGNGGAVNVNAGGIFRATGFIKDEVNLTKVIGRDGKPTKTITGVSIFTGGNKADTNNETSPSDFRGGKINITYKGKSFIVGGKSEIDLTETNGLIVTLTKNGILNIEKEKVVFPDGISGTEGAIVSRNSNGSFRVVFGDGQFFNVDDSSAVQQASKPKSKENCTPSSTSVASNPTAAPTRSAGNPNTVSADPCQPNTGNNAILQILTDRE